MGERRPGPSRSERADAATGARNSASRAAGYWHDRLKSLDLEPLRSLAVGRGGERRTKELFRLVDDLVHGLLKWVRTFAFSRIAFPDHLVHFLRVLGHLRRSVGKLEAQE